MKPRIFGIFVLSAVGFSAPSMASAQGSITYLSNLGDISIGGSAVGSDSWFAEVFVSGNNPEGYVLNSVQLAMENSSGNPTGFTVMLYSAVINTGISPGSNLDSLNGSLDPVTAGTYDYTAADNLTLSPNTVYFLVLTAGTTVANGSYDWSVTSAADSGYNSYHWGAQNTLLGSSDGLDWGRPLDYYGQFALNATAIPEPGMLSLFAAGGLMIVLIRRKRFGAENVSRHATNQPSLRD